jgi:putative sigma-54 modulation protein
VEKKAHRAEIVLHAGRQTLRAQAEGNDLYLTITSAADKMEVQVKKYSEKLKKNKHTRRKALSMKNLPPEPLTEEPKFSVVKEVPVRPMTADNAADLMEKLGYNFWLFLDKDTKKINVTFKRQDNSYGLIRPVRKIK